METEVIMKRTLFGKEISQKSKSKFFSATDLVEAGNIWRITNGQKMMKLTDWLASNKTKEFMKALEKEYGIIIVRSKARNQHTWVHPFLFIDLALSISPELKIEAYRWLYDELMKYRNNSGDSYKKMSGAIYLNSSNKQQFLNDIIWYANKIKLECGVSDWQTATEKQLKLRDKIHENISLLCDVLKSNDDAVRIGIQKAKENK